MFMRRKSTGTRTDAELVALLLQGPRAAVGTLWDRYAHLLFAVCMKYLKDPEQSKDAVADLFAKLPELIMKHEVNGFRPWVHVVMRNQCLMLLRAKHTDATLFEAQLTDTTQDTLDAAAVREASLVQLEEAIAQLKDAQRLCIELFHLQRRSYDEVAASTGFTLEQVRSHLQNGRRNLRIILERHADRNT
jgi:RNA polymerase sigma factor (sigma-70 family)